jgi:hypothetical protein
MQTQAINTMLATNAHLFAPVVVVRHPSFIRILMFSSKAFPLSKKAFLLNIHPQFFPFISVPSGNRHK